MRNETDEGFVPASQHKIMYIGSWPLLGKMEDALVAMSQMQNSKHSAGIHRIDGHERQVSERGFKVHLSMALRDDSALTISSTKRP